MNKFRGVTAHKDSGFVANIGHNGGAFASPNAQITPIKGVA